MDRNKIIRIVIIVVAAFGGRIAYSKFAAGRHTTGDRMADAMAAELGRQGLTAAFNAKVATITDTTAAHNYGAQLGRRGVARLSAPDLVVRAQLLLHLDSLAGDTLCAAHFMGTLDRTAMIRYVDLLDSTRLTRWVQIAVLSMKAEFEATSPLTPPTADEIGATLRTITAAVPEADRGKFSGIFANVAGAPVADQCWAGKTLAVTALGMPEPQREEVLRKLAMLEAGL
jgi:hypothetical protein